MRLFLPHVVSHNYWNYAVGRNYIQHTQIPLLFDRVILPFEILVNSYIHSFDNAETSRNKTETMSEKIERLQNEVETSRICDKNSKDRGAR